MFFEIIWLIIGFLFCFLGIFGGGIYLYGELNTKYNLGIGFIVLILLLILCMWTFKFVFISPYFSF